MACPITEFQIQDTGTAITVTVSGEVEAPMLGDFLDVARRVRGEPGCRALLDLSGVVRLDAGVLPGLLAVQEAVSEVGGQFDVQAPDATTAAMLKAAGVNGLLPFQQ